MEVPRDALHQLRRNRDFARVIGAAPLECFDGDDPGLDLERVRGQCEHLAHPRPCPGEQQRKQAFIRIERLKGGKQPATLIAVEIFTLAARCIEPRLNAVEFRSRPLHFLAQKVARAKRSRFKYLSG